ncbi:hypothetical protein DFH29DRAFT_880070 [Suillus ampliporus]|nr:hypothetical protein DFH29DRAFT_880070 [Suillus ampliporus]
MQRAFNASISAWQFFVIIHLVGCPSLAEPPLSTTSYPLRLPNIPAQTSHWFHTNFMTLEQDIHSSNTDRSIAESYPKHTLTKAVESQIEVRRKQVDDWIGKCEGVESGCARYSRALGTHAKVAGSLSDLKAEKVLPRRYEGATVYQEKLRQMSRIISMHDLLRRWFLEQLTTLINRLNALAWTLGSHFFQPDILTPALVAAEELDDPTALRDVMPERFSKLEKELVRGKGEVIDWLYSELGIDPPVPTITPTVATSSSTLAVPRYSLPRSSSAGSTRLNSNADPFASSTVGPSTPTPSALETSDKPHALSVIFTTTPHDIPQLITAW